MKRGMRAKKDHMNGSVKVFIGGRGESAAERDRVDGAESGTVDVGVLRTE